MKYCVDFLTLYENVLIQNILKYEGNERKKNAVVEIEDEDERLVIWCVKMKNTNVRRIQGLTIASESHEFSLNFLSFQKMCQAVKFLVLFFIVENEKKSKLYAS